MSIFDEDNDSLLVLAFNKPSEKKSEQILARRLCKLLGISYDSLDKTDRQPNGLLMQVVDKAIELHGNEFKGVKGLMPGRAVLANE